MKRVAMYVDGSNIYYAQRDVMGWWMDPAKLYAWGARLGNLVRASYHVGIENEHQAESAFSRLIMSAGFSLKAKQVKTISLPDGSTKRKANCDVVIVAEAIEDADLYDTIVLVSGDSDFLDLLQRLRERGKEIIVLSTRSMVSSELYEFVGENYHDLEDERALLERTDMAYLDGERERKLRRREVIDGG